MQPVLFLQTIYGFVSGNQKSWEIEERGKGGYIDSESIGLSPQRDIDTDRLFTGINPHLVLIAFIFVGFDVAELFRLFLLLYQTDSILPIQLERFYTIELLSLRLLFFKSFIFKICILNIFLTVYLMILKNYGNYF